MSAPRIRGDYKQLAQISQSFGTQATQIASILRRLKSSVSNLEGGDWIGLGAIKFYEEMNTQILPAMQRLAQALHQAQRTTEKISRIIKQAEDDAAKVFKLTGDQSQSGATNASSTTLGGARDREDDTALPEGAVLLPTTTNQTSAPTPIERLAQVMGVVATALDIFSLAISGSGVLLEIAATALGLAVPIPVGDETVGFAGGALLYNTVLNPIENTLGYASLTLVAASEMLTGATHFDGGELVLGPDTTFCIMGLAVGNTPLTPEAITDSAANLAVVYYDIQRLRNQEPAWGLTQIRLGMIGSHPYMRITDENGRNRGEEIRDWFNSLGQSSK